MGRQYECPPEAGLEVTPGTSGWFKLPFPSRFKITKVICVLMSPVFDVPFTVSLHNCEAAMTGDSISEADAGNLDPAGVVSPKLFRVTKDIVAVGGEARYLADEASGGHGYDFFSQDPDQGYGNPRFIYVKITVPAGRPELHVFSLVIGGTAED